ncbi:MAG: 50S ribosome-binding GTPase [Akkermansiaceae bacterium]|nr:50S ribosome-binding GTPase [Akkermansiaceae bacterium]MCF7733592.1 50S ribosome-binding GTPase [Akkermansiaceae bacterium]
MFGERYFATRQRLTRLMADIAALGRQCGVELSKQLPLTELATGLGPPFLLVACGEVNAGKSAFFNGLLGTHLCPMANLPETNQVVWYRHGDPPRDVEVLPQLREAYRPLPGLRDFNLIDTPGLKAFPTDSSQVTERFLSAAELVAIVLPVANPWGAPGWNMISRLAPDTLNRVILVVQQCDRADPADIGVIQGHLRDLAVKRIGRELPVFAVSAKLAFDARQGPTLDTKRLVASGYPALESFLSAMVCDTAERRAMLDTWRGQVATALRTLEDRLDQQNRSLRQQGGFLEDVENRILQLREEFIVRLPQHLKSVAEVFQLESVGVAMFLRRRLGVLRSLFRVFWGDQTSQTVDSVFIERLQAAVEAVAEQDGDKVVSVCREHRQELDQQVRELMGVDLGADTGCEERLALARTWFVQRVGHAAREGIGNLKVRNQLAKDLLRRNRALKSFLFVTLLLVTAAGLCGVMAIKWIPLGLLGVAALFLVAGFVVGWLAKRVVVADFQERLLDTCDGFARTLKSDYENALRNVFQEYLETLAPIRHHLVAAKSGLEPQQQRWTELFLTLKAIEQDL